MKFKKNVISNLILHVLTIGIGFITSILIARGLGTTNQGQFSYYLLIFGIIASYGHIGIATSTSYFLKKTKIEDRDIINTNISVLLILSIFYIIIITIFRVPIFNNDGYLLIMIWSIYTISLLFSSFFVAIYISREDIYVYNKFYIFVNILKGLIIILLYFTNIMNIVSLSIVYAVSELLKIILLIKGIKIKYRFNINIGIITEELKYGIPLYFAGLFIFLNYKVDQIMIKHILGDSELGIYSIAVHLAELAFIFPESIKSAFEGRLYSCERSERKRITAQTIRFTFYSTALICITGILCKPLITILYGIEYENAGVAMVILLLGILFASIGKVSPAFFYTDGKPKIHLRVSASVLIVNLICNIFLIPKMGINGAAIASTISYMIFGLFYAILLKREKIPLKQLFCIQKDDLDTLKSSILKLANKEQRRENENV